jgi:hypothetical protein
MDNVTQTLVGNILTVTIDLSKNFGPSASGKTVIVASTRGGKAVDGRPDVTLSVNAYSKATK